MTIQTTKRVRMFAGPNGSGKSTIKAAIDPSLIGIYVNPDEIEKEMQEKAFLNLENYLVDTTAEEILGFFANSSFLQQAGFSHESQKLTFSNGKLFFHAITVNAYFASVASDFLRHKLLHSGHSFTFETVMSSFDKVEFLQKAQRNDYRTYLYYVATKDPAINVSRVQNRVNFGGHSVPEDKIISRYYRSLELLFQAVKFTNRTYVFDNSLFEHLYIAEITNGQELEMKTNEMPDWFKKALWDKFTSTLYNF